LFTPLSQQLKAAHIVFVATLTEARVVTPIADLRNGESYRINYTFVVRERLKGDPSKVTSIYNFNLYHDPKSSVTADAAEELRLLPGDNILVLTDQGGEVHVGFCSPSRPWDSDTKELQSLRAHL